MSNYPEHFREMVVEFLKECELKISVENVFDPYSNDYRELEISLSHDDIVLLTAKTDFNV